MSAIKSNVILLKNNSLSSAFIAFLCVISGISSGCLVFWLMASQKEVENALFVKQVSAYDAFSIGGIFITILAFAAAFFLLFMALDAFAIYKATQVNSSTIENNESRIAKQSERIDELSGISQRVDEKALLFEIIVMELNSFAQEEEHLSVIVDVIAQQTGVDKFLEPFRKHDTPNEHRMARLAGLMYLTTDHPSEDLKTRAISSGVTLLNTANTGNEVDRLLIVMLRRTIKELATDEIENNFRSTMREELLGRVQLEPTS